MNLRVVFSAKSGHLGARNHGRIMNVIVPTIVMWFYNVLDNQNCETRSVSPKETKRVSR